MFPCQTRRLGKSIFSSPLHAARAYQPASGEEKQTLPRVSAPRSSRLQTSLQTPMAGAASPPRHCLRAGRASSQACRKPLAPGATEPQPQAQASAHRLSGQHACGAGAVPTGTHRWTRVVQGSDGTFRLTHFLEPGNSCVRLHGQLLRLLDMHHCKRVCPGQQSPRFIFADGERGKDF